LQEVALADIGTDAVRWERRTAPELRVLAAQDALVVLPVASMEQHGLHLPVWTDSMIGHACALRAAAEASDVPAIVLPPMWMGLSEHHLPFGGTITLDYATFHGVLRGVCRSIRADGFDRLLVVNSHGGNIDPLAVSTRELCVEFNIPVVAVTIFHVAGPKIGEILDTNPASNTPARPKPASGCTSTRRRCGTSKSRIPSPPAAATRSAPPSAASGPLPSAPPSPA
jgi:creatinine amidohydrolase